LGTRLKNFSRSRIAKGLAFLILVCSFTGAAHLLAKTGGDFGIVFENSYYSSEELNLENVVVLRDLAALINEYKTEQHILDGHTVPDEYRLSEDSRNMIIRNDLRRFHFIQDRLAGLEGRYFYATDGTNVFANSPLSRKEQFQEYRVRLLFEKFQEDVFPRELAQSEYALDYVWIASQLDTADHKIYLAVDDGYLAQKMEEWTARKAEAEERLCWFSALLVLSALSFVFLASVAGRVPGTEGGHASRTEAGSAPQTAAGGAPRHGQGLRHDRGVRMRRIDRWYTDLNAAVVFLLGLFLTLAWADIQGPYMKEAAALVFSLIAVPLLLSLARHLKNRTLFTHTLIFTVVRKIVDGIRHVYNSGSIGMKIVLLAVGYPIVVAATFFMFPVTMGAAAWLGLKKVRTFTEIMRGVERIRNGDIGHKIRVEGRGELAQLADHINGIAEGLRKAVDSELRSERLKTELITNVSHDLRTPLTSIITYIDLLKREQDPARAKEYVEVLDQKAQKLKMLTDGLFEAAKASSGNIPVEMKDLDIVSLIRQGLGELNNEVEKSGLQFRLNVPGDKVMVRADGALLWRAIENLLSNIFKYALKGSRVYIDVEDTEGRVEVTFKNISSQELNMPAEELMERFTRGDESRSSEGSGLGLNIAKSLIELMQGRLHIDIDGDLFKARIVLPKSE